MAIPVWTDDEVLPASDVNDWFVPKAAIKTGDTSRATNTTLAPDPDLTVPVAASAVYAFRMYVGVTGTVPGSGDLKTQFTAPAGATMHAQAVFLSTAGVVNISGDVALSVVTYGTNTTQTAVFLEGTLTTAGTAGNLAFTWAQATSSGTATVVKAGSRMLLQRIG